MTDGGLGGILGKNEEDKPVEGTRAGAAAESLVAGIVSLAYLEDPQVARNASVLLQRHAQLIGLQAQQLHEERRGWPRRLVTWSGLISRSGMALLVVVAVLTVLVLALGAVASRGVVIDAFDAPPALAAHGLSGKVLASGLLDVLKRIQANTRSSAEGRALSNAWTSEIAMEIPDTGISLAEIERVLKSRLGHEQHIGGNLVEAADGSLALTVRGNGVLPRTFTGEARSLDSLLTKAGEYVYSQSQPGLWAAYLSNNNRNDETIRFVQEKYAGADPSEKPYLLNYLGNALTGKGEKGAMRDALGLYREALRLKPDFWIGYTNVMNSLYAIGDEEGVVRAGQELIEAAGGRPGRAPPDTFENYDSAVWDLSAVVAEESADLAAHGGVGTITGTSGSESLGLAETYVLMHDVPAATLALKTASYDEKSAPDVSVAQEVQALLAEETGDFESAARHWDLFNTAYANPEVSSHNPSDICQAASSYERSGQPAKADAALAAVGSLTFVDCLRFKGDVLDLRGDWAGAQEAYAKAVKLAPSIPSGYYSWGLAMARHGDLEGALVKLGQASQKGPHWADPLKALGDVLARKQLWKEAQARYDEALKYAPHWAALQQARDQGARH
jgi:tetratricopeptide (TPR) repeat protein